MRGSLVSGPCHLGTWLTIWVGDMKFRLVQFIRCPVCRSILRLEDPVIRRVDRVAGPELAQCGGLCPFPEVMGRPRDCSACVGYEVVDGFLRCQRCVRHYAIKGGVPRLCDLDSRNAARAKVRTASSYGYLWRRSAVGAPVQGPSSYHFERMKQALALPPPRGLILDAGCGDGIDLVNQARRAEAEVVGVELSDGGCRASVERSLVFPAAHVVQADLCQLPFDDNGFDFVYSYGVLHHLPAPKEGLHELVRVLKPGARVVAYLYEDFSERAGGWRWLLRVVNQLRLITPRVSHRVLYSLCQLASPLVYAVFTIAFRILHHVPGLDCLAASFPFRHATGPFSLAGDLYDRFSAPIEWRYNRAEAVALFQDAGLQGITVVKDRGWMASGIKPSSKYP